MNEHIHQEIISKQIIDSLAGLVAQYLGPNKVAHFETLTDIEDRISFLFQEDAYFPLVQGMKRTSGPRAEENKKDKIVSKVMRDGGNKAFSAGDDATALDCYNQAVMSAPIDPITGQGEDLAIALANRAAVLYRREKYTFCINDVLLADRSGYPDHLKYKLYQRHAKCLSEMFKFSEAIEIFKKAEEAISMSR